MYYNNNRRGCLGGLIELFALNTLFNWSERNVGFGRGGCSGIGCGMIILIIFIILVISVVCGTDWRSFRLMLDVFPV